MHLCVENNCYIYLISLISLLSSSLGACIPREQMENTLSPVLHSFWWTVFFLCHLGWEIGYKPISDVLFKQLKQTKQDLVALNALRFAIVFFHEMNKLFRQTKADLGMYTCKQLVLHQFLAILPVSVSQHLRATAMERAQQLMATDDQGKVMAVVDDLVQSST